MSDRFMTDSDVQERLRTLREEGFPAEKAERWAVDIARYGSGPLAEDALKEILWSLPEENLNRLITRNVMPYDERHPWLYDSNWTDHHEAIVAEELVKKGLGVSDTAAEGWVVELPGGRRLTQQYRDLGDMDPDALDLPGRAVALCRLAILAIWMQGMHSDGT